MQGFLRTPWNATSRTTAQDAVWQHIVNRNTSSQPLITPCARQVMNRIPRSLTPPWAGCWGPPHSCSMSRAVYLPAQRNRQTARPTPQTETPPQHPRRANPQGRKEDPLPAVRINSLEVHQGPPARTSVQPTERIFQCSCLGVPRGGSWSGLPWLSYTSRGEETSSKVSHLFAPKS